MPKDFKFTGSRRYDPTATAAEAAMTDDNEFWGGDTRIVVHDQQNQKWVTIGCFRDLSGGDLFVEMADTTCYGDLHKRYSPRQFDSEPISITISPKSKVPLELLRNAFKNKTYINLMILFADSRYIRGPVRVERIGTAAPIDGVLSYTLSLKRVGMPEEGEGYYSVIFDLQGAKWENGEPPYLHPYYVKDDYIHKDDLKDAKVISPYPDKGFSDWEVEGRLSGKKVIYDSKEKGWKFTDESLVFTPLYKQNKVTVKYIVDLNGNTSFTIPESPDAIAGNQFEIEAYTAHHDTNEKRLLTGWDVAIGDAKEYPANPFRHFDDVTVPHSFVVPPEGATIFGRWEPISEISFEPADGVNANPEPSELPSTVYCGVGTSYTLPPYMTDRNKLYVQTGWLCDKDEQTYYAGGSYKVANKAITFKPVWTSVYRVVYASGDGDVAGAPPSDEKYYRMGSIVTLASSAGSMTRAGYSLTGWKRADTIEFELGAKYEVVDAGIDKKRHEIKFLPVWTQISDPLDGIVVARSSEPAPQSTEAAIEDDEE